MAPNDRIEIKAIGSVHRSQQGKGGVRKSQAAQLSLSQPGQTLGEELPVTVKLAASFLGVSTQTVYLWMERKRIPHLRVMGRNVGY